MDQMMIDDEPFFKLNTITANYAKKKQWEKTSLGKVDENNRFWLILGPISNWPQSLKTTVNICLHATTPTNVVWGKFGIF